MMNILKGTVTNMAEMTPMMQKYMETKKEYPEIGRAHV